MVTWLSRDADPRDTPWLWCMVWLVVRPIHLTWPSYLAILCRRYTLVEHPTWDGGTGHSA